jgi:hypothetical protein
LSSQEKERREVLKRYTTLACSKPSSEQPRQGRSCGKVGLSEMPGAETTSCFPSRPNQLGDPRNGVRSSRRKIKDSKPPPVSGPAAEPTDDSLGLSSGHRRQHTTEGPEPRCGHLHQSTRNSTNQETNSLHRARRIHIKALRVLVYTRHVSRPQVS